MADRGTGHVYAEDVGEERSFLEAGLKEKKKKGEPVRPTENSHVILGCRREQIQEEKSEGLSQDGGEEQEEGIGKENGEQEEQVTGGERPERSPVAGGVGVSTVWRRGRRASEGRRESKDADKGQQGRARKT